MPGELSATSNTLGSETPPDRVGSGELEGTTK